MSNIPFYIFIILFGFIFLFVLPKKFFERNELKKLDFAYNHHIEKFVIIGKRNDSFYMYGDILVDRGNKIFIKPFYLVYYTNNLKIFLEADKGIFIKKVSYKSRIQLFSGKLRKNLIDRIGTLQLIGSVKVKYKNVNMFTNFLIIDTKGGIATTYGNVIFISDRMRTIGNKAVIDINKQQINVYKVKTIYYNCNISIK